MKASAFIPCVDVHEQVDAQYNITMRHCMRILVDILKAYKEEDYPEYFQDRVCDIINNNEIDLEDL